MKPDLPGARLRLAISGLVFAMEDDPTGVLEFSCGKAEGDEWRHRHLRHRPDSRQLIGTSLAQPRAEWGRARLSEARAVSERGQFDAA